MSEPKTPPRDLSAYGNKTIKWVGGQSKWVDQLVDNYKKRARDVVIRAVTDMVDDIKDNTPVDTGALVAHWFIDLNQARRRFNPNNVDPDRSDLADASALTKMKVGKDRVYIYNPAPYAAVIEAVGSKSTSPGQMLAQQRIAWPMYVDRAAQDLGLK